MWGERPPASAAAGVQKYLAGVRQVIGSDRVLTRHPGYLIVVGDDELDLLEFEKLAVEGRAAMDAGDPA